MNLQTFSAINAIMSADIKKLIFLQAMADVDPPDAIQRIAGPSAIIDTTNAIEADADDVIIDIRFVQLGSGTPSTENPRSFKSYTEANVYRNIRRYGALWNQANAACSSRLWSAADISLNTAHFAHKGSIDPDYSNPFDEIYPFKDFKQCNVDIDAYNALSHGDDILDAVVAWYGDNSFETDGSNGFVGAYRPEYWYTAYETGGNIAFGIADGPIKKWAHSAPYIRGIGFGVDGGKDSSNIQLLTCNDGQPFTNVSMANLHTYANNSGFTIDDIFTYSAELTAAVVEFANLNMQTAIGDGVSNLYRQSSEKSLLTETAATRVVLPKAFSASAVEGATLDFGASNGAVVLDNRRTCLGYEEYSDNADYISVLFDEPLDITDAMFVSVHGLDNRSFLGNASGYFGLNGKSTAYYRGSVLHGNRWRYVLGAYREKDTNALWICDNDDPDKYNALNTSVHTDTRKIISTADGVSKSGYIGSLHFVNGLGAIPVAKGIGGNSSNPVGDYVYMPSITGGNTVLLVGGSAEVGAGVGPFCESWSFGSSLSNWDCAVVPILKLP